MNKCIEGFSSAEQDALSLFTTSLREMCAEEIVRLVLFGSRARGEGNEHSDIDVLVLLEHEEHRVRRAILDRAGDIFIEKEINIAPLVMSRERYSWLRKIERGIAREIERDGIEI